MFYDEENCYLSYHSSLNHDERLHLMFHFLLLFFFFFRFVILLNETFNVMLHLIINTLQIPIILPLRFHKIVHIFYSIYDVPQYQYIHEPVCMVYQFTDWERDTHMRIIFDRSKDIPFSVGSVRQHETFTRYFSSIHSIHINLKYDMFE